MNEALNNDRSDKMIHDVRHCLHAMRMGRETLVRLFEDDRCLEICGLMELEEQKVLLLLDELIDALKKKR